MVTEQPIFEVLAPNGQPYKIYESGYVEGFPRGSIIINRFHLRIAENLRELGPSYQRINEAKSKPHAARRKVTVYGDIDVKVISGTDMDFAVDDRGYLTVYDYALQETTKPTAGVVFIAAPGFWYSASFD
jgi:hypothetical protein